MKYLFIKGPYHLEEHSFPDNRDHAVMLLQDGKRQTIYKKQKFYKSFNPIEYVDFFVWEDELEEGNEFILNNVL